MIVSIGWVLAPPARADVLWEEPAAPQPPPRGTVGTDPPAPVVADPGSPMWVGGGALVLALALLAGLWWRRGAGGGARS